jgi:hypothetical protein
MSIRPLHGSLIAGILAAVTVLPGPSAAQSSDQKASASKSAAPNTNMSPHKHRYWRYRGGTHPHYGSRRVRTSAPAAETGAPSAK